MIDSVAILRMKAQSIKSVLEKVPPTEKQGHIATALAQSFNELVKEIGEAFPELVYALPKPITSSMPFARVKKADVSYIDLEIFAEQVLSLLALAQRGM